jgi:glycolate oxidase iron-sulfur subunit
MHLVDRARAHIEETYRRPFMDRLVRGVLARVLPYPARFRAAVRAAKIARPFAAIIRALPGGARLAAMLALAPTAIPAAANPGTFAPAEKPRARVALLRGCAQSVLDPGINAAAIRLMNRAGVAVVVPEEEGCCGALTHHMGRAHDAHAFAKHNIDVWTKLIEGEGLDAVLVTTSGCGTMVKDYGFILRNDPAYAAKAARVSALAKDITEFLETLDLGAPKEIARPAVAYHSACSLQHGQQIKVTPKKLLARAGFSVSEPAEGHLCCGSAGTYNMLQPELANRLRARKVANIEATGAAVIAAGNLGCITQIAAGTKLPAVHTVELLDWAYGGPKPAKLAS